MKVYHYLVSSNRANEGFMLFGASLGFACNFGAFYVYRNEVYPTLFEPLMYTGIGGILMSGISVLSAMFSKYNQHLEEMKLERGPVSITKEEIAKYVKFLAIHYLSCYADLYGSDVKRDKKKLAYAKQEFSYAFGSGLIGILRQRSGKLIMVHYFPTPYSSMGITFESLDRELAKEIEEEMKAYKEDLKGFTNEDGTEDPNRNFLYCRILHVLEDFLPAYRQEYLSLNEPFRASEPKKVFVSKPLKCFPAACAEMCAKCKKIDELYEQYKSEITLGSTECISELVNYFSRYSDKCSKMKRAAENLVENVFSLAEGKPELRNSECIAKAARFARNHYKHVAELTQEMVEHLHEAIVSECEPFRRINKLVNQPDNEKNNTKMETIKSALNQLLTRKSFSVKNEGLLRKLEEEVQKFDRLIREAYMGKSEGDKEQLRGNSSYGVEKVKLCTDSMCQKAEQMELEGKLDGVKGIGRESKEQRKEGRKRKSRSNLNIKAPQNIPKQQVSLCELDYSGKAPLFDEDLSAALKYVSYEFMCSDLHIQDDYWASGMENIPAEFVQAFLYGIMTATENRILANLDKICDYSGNKHLAVRRNSLSSAILKEADEEMYKDLNWVLNSYRNSLETKSIDSGLLLSHIMLRMHRYREKYLAAFAKVGDEDLVEDVTSFNNGNYTDSESDETSDERVDSDDDDDETIETSDDTSSRQPYNLAVGTSSLKEIFSQVQKSESVDVAKIIEECAASSLRSSPEGSIDFEVVDGHLPEF